jgi:hypothetical protein
MESVILLFVILEVAFCNVSFWKVPVFYVSFWKVSFCYVSFWKASFNYVSFILLCHFRNCHFAICHFGKCHPAECEGASDFHQSGDCVAIFCFISSNPFFSLSSPILLFCCWLLSNPRKQYGGSIEERAKSFTVKLLTAVINLVLHCLSLSV